MSLRLVCTREQPDACYAPRLCTQYTNWLLYDVLDGVTDVGNLCLPAGEAAPEPVTPDDIDQIVANLNLPAPNLVIQPPGGRTLVNLDTIFYSTTTAQVTKTREIKKQKVVIEATPATYTFHWASKRDEGATEADLSPYATSDPGRPHPDQTVFHAYSTTTDVTPWVSLTYAIRFKVEGQDWKNASTFTRNGQRQELGILEAKPQLVVR